jgi:hypothetical protein
MNLSEETIIEKIVERLSESESMDFPDLSERRIIEYSKWLGEPVLTYLNIPVLNATKEVNMLRGLLTYRSHHEMFIFVHEKGILRTEAIIGPDTLISFRNIHSAGDSDNYRYEFTLHTKELDVINTFTIKGINEAEEMGKRLVAIRTQIRKNEIEAGRRSSWCI